MRIGVAFDEGQIAANLGSCKQVLVVTTEGREPVSKHMAEVRGASTTDLIKLASMEQIDVLICGSLGLAIRNALEMIGVLLVPGNRFELPGGARLGYCAPEPVLREGLARLGRALRQFD